MSRFGPTNIFKPFNGHDENKFKRQLTLCIFHGRRHEFLAPYLVFFLDLKTKMVVRFVDSGGIVDLC